MLEFSLNAACPLIAAKPKKFFKLQEKNPILNGRPLENTSSPIFFYHSVFGQFLNDFENVDLEIPPDIYKWTQDLIHETIKHYRIEDHYLKALRERFSQKL